MSFSELTKRYAALRANRDGYAAQVYELEEKMKEVESELRGAMLDKGIENMKQDGFTFKVESEIVPKVSDWEAFYNWAGSAQRWELVRRQINVTPFRKMIEDGEELPACVTPEQVTKLSIRKG